MATSGNRRRLSFVDLAHPQAWNRLLEYTEMTIAFGKLLTDFSNQSAKISMLASSQLQQLVHDFRRKTESELRGKCQLGGMMYDLWESLLLESEIESQSLKKMANVFEREISGSLTSFITKKKCQLTIDKEHRRDLEETLATSQEIVRESRDEYATIYHTQGLTEEFDLAHNQYVLELTAGNCLSSKYQMNTLPQLLQGMEQSQLETIETLSQNIHNFASVLQEYHEQRRSSFASFVVTSSTTNPNQELENYICSMEESAEETTLPSAHLQYQSFVSPLNTNPRSPHISSAHNDPLIVYTTPVVQRQLATRSKETNDRLKELKKEKSVLLTVINPPSTKIPVKQQDDQQQSGKKLLHQMSDSMKRKHQLRLIELEEAILLAQQDLLKPRRPSMSGSADNDQDAQKRNNKTTKGLWRDAFRALKTPSNASGTPDEENRSIGRLVISNEINMLSVEEEEQHHTLNVSPATPGRIRSHSLKPQNSRLDYAQRKSATDVPSTVSVDLELSIENTEPKGDASKPLQPSWLKRRFTSFALEQPTSPKDHMTTDRFSFFDERTCSELLKHKRPSVIAQMMESFVRRISSRRKKHNSDREREREREEDQVIIDPVYETLKIAAETRKRTVAHYLQQRQQTLNKQTSLNSQGSSEADIQPSPRVIRPKNATLPPLPQASASSSSGTRSSLL